MVFGLHSKKELNRRDFLKAIGATALATITPLTVRGAEEPVVFALVDGFSGPYAASGAATLEGAKLLLEQVDYTVNQRPIKLLVRDNELKPGVTIRQAREVITKHNAKVVVTQVSSACALATMGVIKELGRSLGWANTWSTKITGEQCNRYTFRDNVNNYTLSHATIPATIEYLKKQGEPWKKWFAISADYGWGRNLFEWDKKVLEQKGGEFVGSAYSPLGTLDFTPFLTRALTAGANCIVLNLFGDDIINATKQAQEFGVKQNSTLVIPGSDLTSRRGIGSTALEGVFTGTTSSERIIPNQDTQRFYEDYQNKYHKVAGPNIALTWESLRVTIEVMNTIGSVEPEKVIPALEDYEFDSTTGKAYIRKWDHQVIKPFVVGIGKGPKEKEYPDDYLKIIGTKTAFSSRSENLCEFEAEF